MTAENPRHRSCENPSVITNTTATWSLCPARPEDIDAIAELRAIVMRPDLERLGRYDEHRVRQRLRDVYAPEHTSLVVVDGEFAGSVTLRPVEDGLWLENFYVSPALQGRGIGTAVLRTLLAQADEEGVTVRLDVLQGSAARALYERHGFTEERQDPVDVFMVRTPVS
ncbi:Ribosomal protein S18 acetylase RimI [Streptomyces atratus]|uniref:Ribosomal protein S18 acetylase RimI n=1 Tax=Streptomyces atratus TaxID=1893 RepID=A0A1K2AGZ7_STRAR|nr:Ribosomal protein S18 acetylase RimI [Streptomyces atratus]